MKTSGSPHRIPPHPDMLSVMGSCWSPLERKIVELYYGENLKMSEVAKRVGRSPRTCFDKLNRIERAIRYRAQKGDKMKPLQAYICIANLVRTQSDFMRNATEFGLDETKDIEENYLEAIHNLYSLATGEEPDAGMIDRVKHGDVAAVLADYKMP